MYKILNITSVILLFIMIVITIITNQTEISLLGLILSKMMIEDKAMKR